MMAAESSSIDRISNLPISILCHILSLLPTKTTVRTMSLVSRRWRNLWKNLEVFDFYDNNHYEQHDFETAEKFMLFTVFVNAVLNLRNKSRDIRKFSLSCYHSHLDTFFAYSVDTWIGIAIGPHLQEFHLTLLTDGFNVPITLFSCSNLVSLSICGYYISLQLQDSSRICLPSLKVLKLEDMCDANLNSMNILFSACPILEILELTFHPKSLATLRVPSSLKRLKLDVDYWVGACLEIDAPGLKYLKLKHITFGNAVGNLHKVEKAYLDLFSTPECQSVDPLINLLRALSGIKHLKMCCSTGEWLFAAPVLDFPKFCYLLHLKIFLPSFNLGFLFDMLQKCPVLQTLTTYLIKRFPSSDIDDSSPSYGWPVKPKSVPKCLVSHLTYFHFDTYEDNVHLLEFIGYVLQNGLVLKTMLIGSMYTDPPEEWMKLFFDLPRGSAMCQLEFL